MVKKIFAVLFVSILFFTTNIMAQDMSEGQSESKIDPVIKMSGISPAVGATYQIGNKSQLRALGFISVDSQGPNAFDEYILSLSYIRELDRIISRAVNWY